MILSGFSVVSTVLGYLQGGIRKTTRIALTLTSTPLPPPPPPSSSSSFPVSWINWLLLDGSKEGPQWDFSGEKLLTKETFEEKRKPAKLRKRPARLVVPENRPVVEFDEESRGDDEKKEFEIEGTNFSLASKRGRRNVSEDGYGFMLDIMGDPKQAYFAVIDGHGGRAAADYVTENLGKNIVNALQGIGSEYDGPQEAIRGAYLDTDRQFLNKGKNGGACTASVVLKEGEIHVAHVGDCRVVLSRNGVADLLTKDHLVSREDERYRIENSGGYVDSRNGVWRVNGTLAVSRAVGDRQLKEWVICDPEINHLPLTPHCHFLIMASDGLWDKVNEQEAVDVVVHGKSSMVESCKKLVEMSFSRGNLDDVTVMVVDLHNFLIA